MTGNGKFIVVVALLAVGIIVWISSGGGNGPPFAPGMTNLVWIQPGTFIMGSPKRWKYNGWHWPPIERKRWRPYVGPETKVTISRGFWMGRFEVTQGEYLSLMHTNPSYFNGVRTKSSGKSTDYGVDLSRAVEMVTWNDAVAFCRVLTTKQQGAGQIPANYQYRLPTEAEWEYACRAGRVTLTSLVTNRGKIGPVGLNQPNAWGLYDMHWNVKEWCLDWYGPYLGGSVIDPTGPESGSHRVRRGGSYASYADPGYSQAINRNWFKPPTRAGSLGFRIVLAPVRPQ